MVSDRNQDNEDDFVNVETERCVLAILVNNDMQANHAYTKLTQDFFHLPGHRVLFECIQAMVAEGIVIDDDVLADRLDATGKLQAVGGRAYLGELAARLATDVNLSLHVESLAEAYRRRQLAQIGRNVSAKAANRSVNALALKGEIEQALLAVNDQSEESDLRMLKPLLRDWLKVVEQNWHDPNVNAGLTTGFKLLDEMTSGFKRGQLTVLAGRPGMGKTALALCLAKNAAMDKPIGVAIFSLEMSPFDLCTRLVAGEACVEARRFEGRNGVRLTDADFGRVLPACARLSSTSIAIADSSIRTIAGICAQVRRWKREAPLGLVVIDYLQYITPRTPSITMEQHITECSRAIGDLAKTTGVPVLMLSQMNRSADIRSEKRPITSDLRGSGSIEQDADMIWFVYRDEEYHTDANNQGIAEIIVTKNRFGGKGTVELRFEAQYTRFDSMPQRERTHVE